MLFYFFFTSLKLSDFESVQLAVSYVRQCLYITNKITFHCRK